MSEVEFKKNGLSNLVEEISRQNNIQAVVWLLLYVFSAVTVRIKSKSKEERILKGGLVRIGACLKLQTSGHGC